MKFLLTLAAAAPAVPWLWSFLYIFLAIAFIGGVIWAINTYIAKIPQPLLVVIAVVVLILILIYFFQAIPNHPIS